MTNQRVTYEDMKGVFVLMPTPAVEGGSDYHKEFTVDLLESARAAKAIVSDGARGLLLTGSLGEAATLTEEEWIQFTETVIKAVAGKAFVFAGPTTLNTRDTIKRAKIAAKAGVDGLLLGRPMWCELGPDAMVQYYKDVIESVPELGIIIYENPGAFKGRIPLEVWESLKEIPQVVGCKYTAFDKDFAEVTKRTLGHIRIMAPENSWLDAISMCPDGSQPACWSSGSSCDPLPAIQLKNALESGDMERAKKLTQLIRYTYETFLPKGDRHLFLVYNIPISKLRVNAAGYMKAGPVRPPYQLIPDDFAKGAMETGRRWKKLADNLRNGVLAN